MENTTTTAAQVVAEIKKLGRPVVEGSARQLKLAAKTIAHHALAAGRTNLPIHVLIETHRALHDVWEIAELEGIECLSFGVMDFVSAHFGAIPGDAMRSPGQFSHPLITRAKVEISAACHAHGKVASHNVCTEIKDLSVVANDAHLASRQFGYQRMWSIHPAQIRPILKAMSPSAQAIDQACEVLLKAQQADWAPIGFGGQLHDRASYRYFWHLLERAHATGCRMPSQAQVFFNASA